MKLQTCEVGMFRLPGIVIEAEEEDWCNSEFGKGMRMTDRLFSFRKESQRDWFILRWSKT